MSANQINSAGSINSEVTTRIKRYVDLNAEERARLFATVDQTDMAEFQAAFVRFNSDEEVDEDHQNILGWVQTFILMVVGHEGEVIATRRKKNGRHGSLEQFLASLNGTQFNPDDVIAVYDDQGEELMETVGRGADKVRKPLVEVRQRDIKSGVTVRLDDGTVYTLADGRRVTFEDVGGEENYMRIVDFSRDGGESYRPVEWKLTLPNSRKNKDN